VDEKTILENISKHMDLLASLQNLILSTAVAAIYMACTRGNELDLKIIKVTKGNAALFLVTLFLTLMTAIFLILVRLYGLLDLLETSRIPDAFTKIATHPWLLNPFAYFGDSLFYRLISAISLLGLVVAWWMSFIATGSLRGKYPRFEFFFGTAFFALSVVTFIAIQQVYFLLIEKMNLVNPVLAKTLVSLKNTRLDIVSWGSVATIVLSIVIHFMMKHLPVDEADS
jgi:hypothetical protein